jgi:ABC-type branched-subunit amino acid transport system permease subunit
MRGSEAAASGIGINLTWQRILIFALSGSVAGVGGTLLVINTQNANPALFNYQFSLVFVVVALTAGVTTIEGAIQGGLAFVVVEQLLTYVPLRFQGLTVVLFAAGALMYTRHPEGIVEFFERKQTVHLQRLFFDCEGMPADDQHPGPGSMTPSGNTTPEAAGTAEVPRPTLRVDRGV